jgi:hypothetical protein
MAGDSPDPGKAGLHTVGVTFLATNDVPAANWTGRFSEP